MTQLEKSIYNQWLIVSRSIDGKPFRVRENFDNFETNEHYPSIVKLARFFNKHKHLNIKTFFEAPYFVLKEKFYPLDFYKTMKAVSTYTKYHEEFLISNPDEDVSLDFIKQSLVFINDFCKENSVPICNYLTVTDKHLPLFFKHLGERKISVYILFAFDGLEAIIKKYNSTLYVQEKCFMLQRLNYIRTKLYTTTKTKKNIENIKKYLKQKGTTI